MKKNIASLTLLVSVTIGLIVPMVSNGANNGSIIRSHIVTAPASATNSSCLQNVMSFIDKGGKIGLIPIDSTVDPAALNEAHILRASEINYSTTMKLWDGVVDPTGAFVDQYGQRLAWTLDYWSDIPFMASDVWFRVWSSDPANTLRFVGNVATNGTTPLTFSPLLRGELWDDNGNKVATYYNGETIVGHPVNRLICMIRIGWMVNNPNELQLNLDYFRNHMSLTNFVAFYRQNGWGTTNWISSRPYLTAGRNQIVRLEGQRRMSMTYGLRQTTSFDRPINWTVVAGRMVDGDGYANTLPIAFYRAFEEGINLPTAGRAVLPTPQNVPIIGISNGPE